MDGGALRLQEDSVKDMYEDANNGMEASEFRTGKYSTGS